MNPIMDNFMAAMAQFKPPEFDPSQFKMPEIKPSQFVINSEQGVASQFCKRLVKWINEFNDSLDDDHEVGVRFVSLAQSVIVHLSNIGYCDPFLISFSGITIGEEPFELIQHVNQISILLTKLPRKDTSEPKKHIGIVAKKDSEE